MADDITTEIYRALRETQEKYVYVYFLLAAAGAAIAFAITQTQGQTLTWSKLPLAAAVACWGLSFYFGCRHLMQVRQALFANYQYIKIERGQHSAIPPHPSLLIEFKRDVEKAADRTGPPAQRQFYFLIAGAAFYIAWHVLEMYLRTASHVF